MSRKYLVPLVLPGDPSGVLEAAPKQYVDGSVSLATLQERSKGGGLVVNGTGILGNNTNFSQATFAPLDHPVGATGGFTLPGGAVVYGDEYIPINPSNSYTFGCWVRETHAAPVSPTFYAGIAPYDASNLGIQPSHVAWQPSTTTTLAAALNPGNTTITLTSAANWNNSPAGTYLASILVWNYVDALGFAWPTETYSRNWYENLWAAGGISGNVITLKVPWAGPAISAGTALSNGTSGGTFMYSAWVGNPTPATWTWKDNRTAPYTGVNYQTVPTTAFPQGCVKVKVMFLGLGTTAPRIAGVLFEEYGHNHTPQQAGAQPADPDLTALVQRFDQASTSYGDTFKFYEAVPNGTNYIHLLAPTALSASYQVSLPSTAGTLATTADVAAGGFPAGTMPANADWNTYTTPGQYATTYATGSNFPTGVGGPQEYPGVLTVFKGSPANVVIQEWVGGSYLYTRATNPDIPSAWFGWQAGGLPPTDEVFVGASEPTSVPSIELWYDTDDDTVAGPTAVAGNALGIVAVGSFVGGSGWSVPVGTTRFTNYLPFTSVVGRRYRMVIQVRTMAGTGGSGVNILPRGSGADKGAGWDTWVNTTSYGNIHSESVFDGTGVAETQYHWLVTATVATTFYLDGLSTFYIEDVGPNTAPALPVPNIAPAWTPLTLQNSWVNAGSPRSLSSYRKIGDMVQLRLAVSGGSSGTVIATLPAGFMPPGTVDLIGRDGTAPTCVFNVNSVGQIIWYGPGGTTGNNIVALNQQFSVTA